MSERPTYTLPASERPSSPVVQTVALDNTTFGIDGPVEIVDDDVLAVLERVIAAIQAMVLTANVTVPSPMAVTGPLTNDQLRFAPVSVSVANGLVVNEIVSTLGYNLLTAPYSVTTNIADDYMLDTITFQFTTTAVRTITITRPDGSKLWEKVSQNLEVVLEDIDEAFDGGDNFTIAITQTAAACLVDVSAKITRGSATVIAGSAVTQGTSPWAVEERAPISARTMGRFFNIRGQRHIATTGYVQQTMNTAREPIALLKNPTGSGQVMMLETAEFGATVDTRFSRYGGGTTPLNGAPVKRPVGRTDGGVSASPMELYTGGNASPQFFHTVAGHASFVEGTLRKVATMPAFETYQLLGVDGTIVLQPGQQAYWIVDEIPGGGGGNFWTFIDFEWVEIPTAEWALMVTALQARATY